LRSIWLSLRSTVSTTLSMRNDAWRSELEFYLKSFQSWLIV
jgi:hypothetical protein